jgi:hypothetical protein
MEMIKNLVTIETITPASVEDNLICDTDQNYFLFLSENTYGITDNIANVAYALQNINEDAFFVFKGDGVKVKSAAKTLLLIDSIVEDPTNDNKVVPEIIEQGIYPRPFPRKLITPLSKI